jgi:hypothetical protein
VSAEFWRGRDYFLDKRIRDMAMRGAEAAPEPLPPPPPGPATGAARAADP